MKHDIETPLQRNRKTLRLLGIDDYAGCYAVLNPDGVCLYVGKSNKVLSRVVSHYVNKRDGNPARWMLCGFTEWYFKSDYAPDGSILRVWKTANGNESALENALIAELKPTRNGIGGGKKCADFSKRVTIQNSDSVDFGLIVGESRDKTCWWIVKEGNKTKYGINKALCKVIQ